MSINKFPEKTMKYLKCQKNVSFPIVENQTLNDKNENDVYCSVEIMEKILI